MAMAVACDIVAYKMVSVFSTFIMGSAFIFPSLYSFINVIAELYGPSTARFILFIHIVGDCIFTFLILSIVHQQSPPWWTHQNAYLTVLSPMNKLYFSGMLADLGSTLINIHLLNKWKNLVKGKFFIIRGFFASAIGIIS